MKESNKKGERNHQSITGKHGWKGGDFGKSESSKRTVACKLRYKKVKLDKYVEKGNRKKDKIMFQKDQKSFFVRWRK